MEFRVREQGTRNGEQSLGFCSIYICLDYFYVGGLQRNWLLSGFIIGFKTWGYVHIYLYTYIHIDIYIYIHIYIYT